MKILFLSIGLPNLSTSQGDMYGDLLRELKLRKHDITIIAPAHKTDGCRIEKEGDFTVLRVPLKPFRGDIPFYKKGVRILYMSLKYKLAYKKHLKKEKFDIVMMATPPATLVDVAELIKKQSGAKLYLILRDIHPECLNRKVVPKETLNRTDVYVECKNGFGVIYFVYRLLYTKSQKLYKISDWVGCMSPKNQEYIQSIAPYLDKSKIVLLPNWYSTETNSNTNNNADNFLQKYDLKDKYLAIFGGTIGPAQAIWNIASLAKHCLDRRNIVFLVIGRGWKKNTLEKIAKEDNLTNMLFFDYLPKREYENILRKVDVGLISIDEKYTVPTCPSKIIGYMSLAKPVIAMFNQGNDYGEYYIDKANCGLWSVDLDNEKMYYNFDWMYEHPEERKKMGKNGYDYFVQNLTTEAVCDILCQQLFIAK